jgi:hypothetical protein
VLVTWCNGVIKSSFTPAAGDTLDLNAGTALKTIEPLAPFVKKTVQPWGLGLNVGQYAGHFAWGVLWTGKSSGRTGQGPSIDQYVSDAIAKSGVNLPVPLMNTGVRVIGDGKPSSWRAAGQQNTWEIDPNRLFDRMFASLSQPTQSLDVVKVKRKSVIDFVRRELEGFGKRLGTEDRAKIDAHFTSLRDIEKRLSATGASASCAKPMIGTGGSKQDVTVLHKTMFDLIAAALRCDLTRVATLDTYDDGGGDGQLVPLDGHQQRLPRRRSRRRRPRHREDQDRQLPLRPGRRAVQAAGRDDGGWQQHPRQLDRRRRQRPGGRRQPPGVPDPLHADRQRRRRPEDRRPRGPLPHQAPAQQAARHHRHRDGLPHRQLRRVAGREGVLSELLM